MCCIQHQANWHEPAHAVYTHERTRGGRLKLILLHEFRSLPTYVHEAVTILCRNIHLYLYHVLKEVSEVVFLVDKHLDVPTRVGVLWHTGCEGGRVGEDGEVRWEGWGGCS